MAKSIFTHRVTQELEVPDTDPVQRITIRKLAGRHLETAAVEAQRKSLDNVRHMGGPAMVKEFLAMREPKPASTPETVEAVAADPMSGYDPISLAQQAVVSWTFEEPLTPTAIEEMDDDTLGWLSAAVLKLAKPRLFLTAEEREVARGNG